MIPQIRGGFKKKSAVNIFNILDIKKRWKNPPLFFIQEC